MSGDLFAHSARKSKGKYLNLQNVETLGCAMCMVKLPAAENNGSEQKRTYWHEQLKLELEIILPFLVSKHISLNDENAQELVNFLSECCIFEQTEN